VGIGNFGVGAESNTIRIGIQGTQKVTYIAGIAGTALSSGDAVNISSTGQLGIVMSSARYKRDIQNMDAASSNLMKLRPVTFRYKDARRGRYSTGWWQRRSRSFIRNW
jgi:Chaperone of endosialidase